MNQILPIQPNHYDNPAPQTIIIYKTYTKAVKKAQEKYRMTDKGKASRERANKRFINKHRERINAKNRTRKVCPHCKKHTKYKLICTF